jgi:hypothetical protein
MDVFNTLKYRKPNHYSEKSTCLLNNNDTQLLGLFNHKCNKFRITVFKDPLTIDIDDDPFQNPVIIWNLLSCNEVKRVITKLNPIKALGTNGLSFLFFQAAYNPILNIFHIFS